MTPQMMIDRRLQTDETNMLVKMWALPHDYVGINCD